MSRLDVVIFGATGFTGKQAVYEAVRLAQSTAFTWGVAGRSRAKLYDVLHEVEAKTDVKLSDIPVIITEVEDYPSLLEMCAQAKVVVNCCGPYRKYGEPVVKACVEKAAHHVDISGEPQFIESMQLKYDEQARAAGVYIISACGFDSIPNDLGVMYLKQKFAGTVNSVESYLSSHRPPEYLLSPALHYGTWESMVTGISTWGDLKELRKQLFPTPMPVFKPKLEARCMLHKQGRSWCVPFPGADGSIVYRTQRYFHDKSNARPIQFKAYLKLGNLFTALIAIFFSTIIYVMCKFSFTRALLLACPTIFSAGMVSHKGPPEEVMKSTKFRMTLHGNGWDHTVEDVNATAPNKNMIVTVSGVNPGYGATVTMLLISALTILQEEKLMPDRGGVLTTGAAFANTNIIKNLHENNVLFEFKKVE